ncbi:hypothetical protein PS15p_205743 [Mucor circinelloides]
MNIQDSSTSSSHFDTSTSDNSVIPIATTTEESSSTLLHRLHTNERQLRTLAVILSLTGGLSLSFALGVGIMIYWYSRKCKQRRKLHGNSMKSAQDDGQCENDDDDEKSCTTTNYSYCASCDMMVQDQQIEVTSDVQNSDNLLFGNAASVVDTDPLANSATAAATCFVSSSIPSSSASSTHRMEAIDLAHLPPPPLSHLPPTPEPSAPSAKELHHLHPSSSRSNQQQDPENSGNQIQDRGEEEEEEELCHDCLVPPPAYTKEL